MHINPIALELVQGYEMPDGVNIREMQRLLYVLEDLFIERKKFSVYAIISKEAESRYGIDSGLLSDLLVFMRDRDIIYYNLSYRGPRDMLIIEINWGSNIISITREEMSEYQGIIGANTTAICQRM